MHEGPNQVADGLQTRAIHVCTTKKIYKATKYDKKQKKIYNYMN